MKGYKFGWTSLVIAVVITLSWAAPAVVEAAGPEPVQISFASDRAQVQPGQCATLAWSVKGGFSADLNGQPVALNGQKQVCPQQTQVYLLAVDAGDRMEMREVAIVVSGGPAPQPAAQPGMQIDFRADRTSLNAGECTTLRWDVENVKQVYLDGKGVVGHSSKKVCPTKTHTHVLHIVYNGGTTDRQLTIHVNGGAPAPANPGQPGGSSADLAVTDLYADHLPIGTVWVRVTNHGPATLTNAQIEMKCNSYGKPLGAGNPWSHVEAPWLHTVSLQPGQTASFQTKMAVDTDKYSYEVKCTVSAPSNGASFSDPNLSNNGYSETVAGQQAGQQPGQATDLAVTDLYADKVRNGRLYARLTNRSGARLDKVAVELQCQGAGWAGNSPTAMGSTRHLTVSLNPGQTASFDTGIVINIDQFGYYEMTCTAKGGFNDPNLANNSYSEKIP